MTNQRCLTIMLFVIGCSTEITMAQCTDSSTWIYEYSSATRLNGNLLKLDGESQVFGNYRYYWQLYLDSAFYFNNTFVTGNNSDTASPGVTVDRWNEPTLQTYGAGTYALSNNHNAFNVHCSYWDSTYYTSVQIQIQRPVLQRTVIPFFLGVGVVQSNDYSSQTTMSVANSNRAPETPQWSIVSPGSYGNLSCLTCVASVFTATAPPTACGAYNVIIKASFNGFLSDPFWIDIQTPNLLGYVRTDQYQPAGGGWESHVFSKVVDGCRFQMTNITINEVFIAWSQNNGSNWQTPLRADGWQNLTYDGLTSSYLLQDFLYEIPFDGRTPPVQNNGANGYDESPSSLGSTHTQQFRAGSAYNGGPGGMPSVPYGPVPGSSGGALGVLVQNNPHYHYLDHGAY